MNKANIKQVAGQLEGLKPKLTWKDREDAAVELRKSVNTINSYLNNRVSNEALALEMLRFFKERISEREKALSA